METRISNILGGAHGQYYRQIIKGARVGRTPHETFLGIWNGYRESGSTSNNRNGRIFEYAICEAFANHGVTGLYHQCVFWSMPNDRLDISGWTGKNYPIIISCKTSIRERWKQADLEGRVLKGIFPGTKSYIVMEDDAETLTMRERIGNRKAPGIDAVFNAKTRDLDCLVDMLHGSDLVSPRSIKPLSGTPLCG